MRPEARLEKWFVDWCWDEKLEQRKLQSVGRRGWPDRTILLPGGRSLYIELKAPKGDTSHGQDTEIDMLRGLGFDVLVSNDREEIKQWVISRRYGSRTRTRRRASSSSTSGRPST